MVYQSRWGFYNVEVRMTRNRRWHFKYCQLKDGATRSWAVAADQRADFQDWRSQHDRPGVTETVTR